MQFPSLSRGPSLNQISHSGGRVHPSSDNAQTPTPTQTSLPQNRPVSAIALRSILSCLGVQSVFTSCYAASGATGALIFNAAQVTSVPVSYAASTGAAGSVLCCPLSACLGVAMSVGAGREDSDSNQSRDTTLTSAACGSLVSVAGNAMLHSQMPASHAALIGAVGAPVVTVGVGLAAVGLMCIGGTMYLCYSATQGNAASVAEQSDLNTETRVMVNISHVPENEFNSTLDTASGNEGVLCCFPCMRHPESSVPFQEPMNR